MENRDREAIEDLFRRIAEVERQSGPRDREAAALIKALIAQNPSAPYYMAQTIIVQQQALEAAQGRIEQLAQGGAQGSSGGGFLGSLLGGGGRAQGAPNRGYEERGPWGGGRRMGGGMGGGFLAGAAQTAMGVAGGVVLGNMLAGWLSPDDAAAGLGGEASNDPGLFGGNDAADTDVADAGDFGGDFDVGEL